MRFLRRILLALLLVIVGPLAWLAYEVHTVYTDVQATYVAAPRLAPEPKVTPITNFFGNRRINILLLGSDNDAKFVQKYPLTQSMIVVSIDPVHDTVNMLSIPRDFWVDIPQVGMGKIDTAAEIGGVSLARATVESLFNVNIDYYAWVGLNGFSHVVDDFGGVTIDVSHPILDDFYPNDQGSANPYGYERLFIPAGWTHLSGRQALEYVRTRHGDLAGDFGRSARQQQVLMQLERQANGWNLLLKIPELANAMKGMLQTDLSPNKLFDLARLARHIPPSHITRVVLSAPTYCTPDTTADGQNILDPDWQTITPVVQKLFAPITAEHPAASATSTPATAATSTAPAGSPTTSTATPLPRTTETGPATRAPTAVPSLSPTRLPADLIYASGGTFYEMRWNGQSSDIMPNWMTAADTPAISADGHTLVFMRWAQDASNIDVYDLQTRQTPTQITNDAPPDPTDPSDGIWGAWPSWSADGRTVLFSSDRYKLQSTAGESRQIDLAIYAMNPDGSNLRQTTQPAAGAGGDTDPQFIGRSDDFLYDHWSYSYQDGVPVGQPYSQLMIGNLNNPNASWTLTAPGGEIVQPAVDAAGGHIAYVQSEGTASKLVVAPLIHSSGGYRLDSPTVIASGEVGQPAFSPDGRTIAFLQAEGTGFALYLEPDAGGPAVKLTAAGNGLDAVSRPVWVPHTAPPPLPPQPTPTSGASPTPRPQQTPTRPVCALRGRGCS